MSHKTGVWIDHRKAVIVSAAADDVTVMTLESDVEPHPHFADSQAGGGEKKYEERHLQQLARFYDEVLGQLGQPEAVLIFGPGGAKHELKARLGRSPALSASIVALEGADSMTDPQIVARVKEHYGLAH